MFSLNGLENLNLFKKVDSYKYMNYLSFDVGIKNLAYCTLNPDKGIVDWGIINMNKNPTCQVKLRKKCEKQATYEVRNDNNVKFCCSAHSKRFKKKKKLNNNKDILNKLNRSEYKWYDLITGFNEDIQKVGEEDCNYIHPSGWVFWSLYFF